MRAAERLPAYDNRDYYALGLQAIVRDEVRSACRHYDELTGEIRDRLSRPPWAVVVEGLHFDSGNRLFVALNRAFGDLVAGPYRKPRAQLVHYIQPSTDLRSKLVPKAESERLHTDNADWPRPVEFLSMTCVRPDPTGGGRSLLLDSETFREIVADRLGDGAVEHLESRPVPWKIADYLGGGVTWQPVLDGTRLRWRRYTNVAAAEDGAAIDAETEEVIAAVDGVLSTTDEITEFLLRKGDWLFMNNNRALHARTPLGPGEEPARRLMIRSWVRPHETERN